MEAACGVELGTQDDENVPHNKYCCILAFLTRLLPKRATVRSRPFEDETEHNKPTSPSRPHATGCTPLCPRRTWHTFSRELAALRERLTTLGYQDGVDDGVQEAVQEGFDKGYAAAAAAGWDVGLLYGGAAAAGAAIAASRGRSAEVGAEGTTVVVEKAVVNTTIQDEPNKPSAGLTADSSTSGEGGGGGDRASATSLPGETLTMLPQSARLLENDGKEVVGAVEDLQGLVEELRHASLLGPDGPGAPDRVDVLRRLRLAGPAGVAVADVLDAT